MLASTSPFFINLTYHLYQPTQIDEYIIWLKGRYLLQYIRRKGSGFLLSTWNSFGNFNCRCINWRMMLILCLWMRRNSNINIWRLHILYIKCWTSHESLQGSQIWFPAPKQMLTYGCNSSSRGFNPFFRHSQAMHSCVVRIKKNSQLMLRKIRND